VHRQAASTEGAAQALQRTNRRLREALAGSRRRAVLQWRALDGRGRRAKFGWGRRGWSGGVPGKRFHVELPTAADGGWLITGAQQRVGLGWSTLLLGLGLAGTNNTKTQAAQGDALALDNDNRMD
jgi:hypothetical protein